MSQHDFDITSADTNTGSGFRAAVNAALQALASNSDGTTEPTTPYANQFWADEDAGLFKMRNAGNTAWVTVGTLGAIKAVTNGDEHNHFGGDGALIDHANLISIGYHTHSQIDAHITLTSGNPHSVTKTEVGLGNVLNTEQVSKSDYTANSILGATVSATPITITITEQTIVGRKTGGSIAALSGDDVYSVIGEPDNVESATPTEPSITGIKVELTAGETFSPYRLGCIQSDGKIWYAENNITYTPALYLCGATTITADASGTFLKFGLAKNSSWDLTPGSPVYVGDSDGLITQTVPSASNKVVQIVGFALDSTIIDFSPIFSYILLT